MEPHDSLPKGERGETEQWEGERRRRGERELKSWKKTREMAKRDSEKEREEEERGSDLVSPPS